MVEARSGNGNIERTLQLLWGTEPAAARGPRRSLSVTAIVDQAIAIADADGLDAVSIRSVAAALGAGAMSLYRYIPSKAELLDLMLDRVGQPIVEPLPAGWRPGLEAIAREMWRLHTTHRWLPLVDQARPVLGPNAVRFLDQVMCALSDCPLADQEKMSLTIAIESFVTALARTANAMATAPQRTGISTDEFWEAQEAILSDAMRSGRYPYMAELDADTFAAPLEQTFEQGLSTILDGIQVMLDQHTRHASPASTHTVT